MAVSKYCLSVAQPGFRVSSLVGFCSGLGKSSFGDLLCVFPGWTAMQADYVFPDHTGLEAWGYQKVITGTDRPVISGLQPVVAPLYDTRQHRGMFIWRRPSRPSAGPGDQQSLTRTRSSILQQSLTGSFRNKAFTLPRIFNHSGYYGSKMAAGGTGRPAWAVRQRRAALDTALGQSTPAFDGDGRILY